MQKKTTSQEKPCRNGFLTRPFCQASLDDHRKLALRAQRDLHGPAVDRQICHFLKGNGRDCIPFRRNE